MLVARPKILRLTGSLERKLTRGPPPSFFPGDPVGDVVDGGHRHGVTSAVRARVIVVPEPPSAALSGASTFEAAMIARRA